MTRRRSRFERDFRDLHGHDPGIVELAAEPAGTRVGWANPRAQVGFAYAMPIWARLALGSVGLFWGVMLGCAALGVAALLALFAVSLVTA